MPKCAQAPYNRACYAVGGLTIFWKYISFLCALHVFVHDSTHRHRCRAKSTFRTFPGASLLLGNGSSLNSPANEATRTLDRPSITARIASARSSWRRLPMSSGTRSSSVEIVNRSTLRANEPRHRQVVASGLMRILYGGHREKYWQTVGIRAGYSSTVPANRSAAGASALDQIAAFVARAGFLRPATDRCTVMIAKTRITW